MLRFIARVIFVPLGFVIGTLAALFVLATLGVETFTQDMTRQVGGAEDGDLIGRYWGYFRQAEFLWTAASAVSLVPAILLVIVGEVAKIRSALFYVGGAGLIVALTPMLMGAMRDGAMTTPAPEFLGVLATAGFSGGLLYWAIAGRKA